VRVVVRNTKKREKRKNGIKVIGLAVVVLLGAIAFCSASLQKEKQALEKLYRERQEELQSEQERSVMLTERQAYMQTIRYIEEVAREKLGLVYEDEIIFRPRKEE